MSIESLSMLLPSLKATYSQPRSIDLVMKGNQKVINDAFGSQVPRAQFTLDNGYLFIACNIEISIFVNLDQNLRDCHRKVTIKASIGGKIQLAENATLANPFIWDVDQLKLETKVRLT